MEALHHARGLPFYDGLRSGADPSSRSHGTSWTWSRCLPERLDALGPALSARCSGSSCCPTTDRRWPDVLPGPPNPQLRPALDRLCSEEGRVVRAVLVQDVREAQRSSSTHRRAQEARRPNTVFRRQRAPGPADDATPATGCVPTRCPLSPSKRLCCRGRRRRRTRARRELGPGRRVQVQPSGCHRTAAVGTGRCEPRGQPRALPRSRLSRCPTTQSRCARLTPDNEATVRASGRDRDRQQFVRSVSESIDEASGHPTPSWFRRDLCR